jgi:hypothetical protein
MTPPRAALLSAMTELMNSWRPVFAQERTFVRARGLAWAWLFTLGRRTISRAICTKAQQQRDWSADYRLLSRSKWSQSELYQVSMRECLQIDGPDSDAFVVAMDDTGVPKRGKKTPQTTWMKDPQSPPFWVNLMRGQRFIQVSALLRPEGQDGPCRAVPVRFQLAPAIAKPGKNASAQDKARIRRERRERGLAAQGVELLQGLRQAMHSQANRQGQRLLVIVDGSYTNSTVFKRLPEGIDIVGRTRKDVKLCTPYTGPTGRGRRRIYGDDLPTPEELRKDESVPFETVRVCFGGKRRDIRYKTLSSVLWRKGGGPRPLRLIVIAPTGYRLSRNSKLLYRKPAYLLTTALDLPVDKIIQHYLDRFQIEQNHRDEKDLLGLGQAQVRSPRSVSRAPAFVAALYSVLLLASLRAYGPKRTSAYLPLPKWRRKRPHRPSTHDILAQLRTEILLAQAQSARHTEGLPPISKRFWTTPQAPEMLPVDPSMAITYAMT